MCSSAQNVLALSSPLPGNSTRPQDRADHTPPDHHATQPPGLSSSLTTVALTPRGSTLDGAKPSWLL